MVNAGRRPPAPRDSRGFADTYLNFPGFPDFPHNIFLRLLRDYQVSMDSGESHDGYQKRPKYSDAQKEMGACGRIVTMFRTLLRLFISTL